jgi:hypothetical protein
MRTIWFPSGTDGGSAPSAGAERGGSSLGDRAHSGEQVEQHREFGVGVGAGARFQAAATPLYSGRISAGFSTIG